MSPRIELSEEETQLVEQLLREEVEKGLGSTSFRTTNPHETFLLGFRVRRLKVAVSHISRKTSEIWGTPCFADGKGRG